MIGLLQRILEAEARHDSVLIDSRKHADNITLWTALCLYLVCLSITPINQTFNEAIVIGMPTLMLASILNYCRSGALLTRIYMSCVFMTFTGLLIHQLNGDIEAHFAAFGLIGVLLFYRDWRCIGAATAFIYLHHLVLGYAQAYGAPIYVFDNNQFWQTFGLHVAYFLPFISMMGYLSIWLRIDASDKAQAILFAERIAADQFGDIDPSDLDGGRLARTVVKMKSNMQELISIIPVPLAVIRLADNEMLKTNRQWDATLGHNQVINEAILHEVADHRSQDSKIGASKKANGKVSHNHNLMVKNVDGQPRHYNFTMHLSQQNEEDIVIITAQDITDHLLREQQIRALAYHDELTKLPNRTALIEALDKTVQACALKQEDFGIAIFDLDGFKPINDQYGHDAGDLVLTTLGRRLTDLTEEPHLFARIGGDEFVALLHHIKDISTIVNYTEQCLKTASKPIRLEKGVYVKVGISAGIAHFPAGSCMDANVALKQADVALYDAKKAGKNCWRLAEQLPAGTSIVDLNNQLTRENINNPANEDYQNPQDFDRNQPAMKRKHH